jgi:tetratricopeptide (TPR) repeat protein
MVKYNVFKIYFKICFLLFLPFIAFSQSIKDMEDEAIKLHQAGNFRQAASLWVKLFNEKEKANYAFEAAENYYLLKDYRQAASFYLKIKNDYNKFDNLIYKYAKCLKQDGQYETAIKAFQLFLKLYEGSDKGFWEEMVALEQEGCSLGLKLPESISDQIALRRPKELNTDKDEFSVSQFDENYLFYASTASGKSTIMASAKKDKSWDKGVIPSSFPLIPNGQVSTGSFNADGTRFYFTICAKDGAYDNRLTRCEIYRMKKIGSSWSQPIRLPDDINLKGFTATHPNVVTKNGREILYFVSDRPSGRGGMDIWFVSRDASSEDAAFLMPVNAGPTVNTQNDELSPFYHVKNNILYFSSNGFPSLGGFDIFSATGTMSSWGEVKNIGLPYNSPADDLHFSLSSDEKSGWLTSNRIYESEKLITTNNDIFQFEVKPSVLKLYVEVFDVEGKILPKFSLKLFEDPKENKQPQLSRDYTIVSQLALDVLPNRDYLVRIQAPGFLTEEQPFKMAEASDGRMKLIFKLKPEVKPTLKQEVVPVVVQKRVEAIMEEVEKKQTSKPEVRPSEVYRAKGISPYDSWEYESDAPRLPGISYKIQLEATDKVQMEKYVQLSNLGNVHTEYLIERKLFRMLIGPFPSVTEAKSVKASSIKSGFLKAFIVKYEDGIRVGMTGL